MTFSRILLPTDFSETAELAAAYGREMARRFDARLHLLHVVPDLMQQTWATDAVPLVSDLLTSRRADAEQRLAEIMLDDLVAVRAVRVGHAFVEIVRYAAENAVDLIVMGTHGRGPVEHLLLGSVTEKVVQKAPCPVLTVKQAGHVFVMPAVPVPAT